MAKTPKDDLTRFTSDAFHNWSVPELLEEAKDYAEKARESRELAKTLWKMAGHYLVAAYRKIGDDLFEQARLCGITPRDARRMMKQAGWQDPDTPARSPNVKILFDRFRECWPVMGDAERDKFAKVFFEAAWPTLKPAVQRRYRAIITISEKING